MTMAARKLHPAPADGLVLVGVVTGARGLRGDVRVRSFTADPVDIAAYGPLSDETGSRVFDLRVIGQGKGQVIVRIPGIEDRDGAEALKGLGLHVPRTALPEPAREEYYHVDLVGVRAELADGEVLGTVLAVHNYGAGTVLEIAGGGRGIVMAPFTRAVVPVVDVAAGRVVINPPPGLLEAPEPEAAAGAPGDGDGT